MNSGIVFRNVRFVSIVDGTINLPFTEEKEGFYKLAPCNYKDIVLNIRDKKIPVKADPKEVEKIIHIILFGEGEANPSDTISDSDLNGVHRLHEKYLCELVHGRFLRTTFDCPIITFYDGSAEVLDNDTTLLNGWGTYKVELRPGLDSEAVIDTNCCWSFNPNDFPFIDIKYIGQNVLCLQTNLSFEENRIPNNYTVEIDNGVLVISDENGNRETWDWGYVVIYDDNNRITNMWIEDADYNNPSGTHLPDLYFC